MSACGNNLRGSIHYSDMPAIFLNTIPKKFNHIGKSLALYISEKHENRLLLEAS